MSRAPATQTGYSSEVRLYLIVNDSVLPLSQIGPDSIVLKEAADLPPCRGEILMLIDGRERRWPVVLPNGAVPFDAEVVAQSA